MTDFLLIQYLLLSLLIGREKRAFLILTVMLFVAVSLENLALMKIVSAGDKM